MYRHTNSLVSGLLATVIMTATLLPIPLTSTSSVAGPTLLSEDFKASVQAEDNSSLAEGRAASVVNVRNVMVSVTRLATSGPEGLELTRAALNLQYPGLVSEQSLALYYTWIQDPETGEWEYVCCSPTQFHVGLATPVVVRADVLAPLD